MFNYTLEKTLKLVWKHILFVVKNLYGNAINNFTGQSEAASEWFEKVTEFWTI